MSILGFWNQLKKQIKNKLRSRRGLLNLALLLMMFGLTAGGFLLLQNQVRPAAGTEVMQDNTVFMSISEEQMHTQPEEEVVSLILSISAEREVYSKKAYICGEEVERLGMMDSETILKYYRNHPHVTVTLGDQGTVIFTEQVQDLSPQCKESAYIGLDEDGNLSLFDGLPSQDNPAVRTFFQLDIKYLESSLPRETVEQLYQGIRVFDMEEYNSVLSTFSDFALDRSERVMQQVSEQ